jgi:hypothetical protein
MAYDGIVLESSPAWAVRRLPAVRRGPIRDNESREVLVPRPMVRSSEPPACSPRWTIGAGPRL